MDLQIKASPKFRTGPEILKLLLKLFERLNYIVKPAMKEEGYKIRDQFAVHFIILHLACPPCNGQMYLQQAVLCRNGFRKPAGKGK